MTQGKNFKRAVRERMARTGEAYSTARRSMMPHCTAEEPCPISADPIKWIHEFEKEREGPLFDTIVCKHCSFECKAAPKQ